MGELLGEGGLRAENTVLLLPPCFFSLGRGGGVRVVKRSRSWVTLCRNPDTRGMWLHCGTCSHLNWEMALATQGLSGHCRWPPNRGVGRTVQRGCKDSTVCFWEHRWRLHLRSGTCPGSRLPQGAHLISREAGRVRSLPSTSWATCPLTPQGRHLLIWSPVLPRICFPVQVNRLPRETLLCATLYALPIPLPGSSSEANKQRRLPEALGWVTTPLFNFRQYAFPRPPAASWPREGRRGIERGAAALASVPWEVWPCGAHPQSPEGPSWGQGGPRHRRRDQDS